MKELQTYTYTVEEAGRTFDFQLHKRDVPFGWAGIGQYFWMNNRRIRHGVGGPNFRPCIDLWWHLVERANVARHHANEMNLLLAECYSFVNASKGMQEAYRDAHLSPKADRQTDFFLDGASRKRLAVRTDMLPEEDVERLRTIAHSRDTSRIRAELDGLFRGPSPPAHKMRAFDKAAQAWIGNGIVALRQEGRDGLKKYLSTIDKWIFMLRKRGNTDQHVRMFLNKFSYECKVAFYSCYSNAWVGILHKLREMGVLDRLGERFMRIWHYQTPPAKGHQDIFGGQIPALHPLSAIVLTSPQHLEVIGRYIGRPDYDELQASGAFARTEEYWEMVAMFLVAAHEYVRSGRHWELQRKKKPLTDWESRDEGTPTPERLFEEFAARRKLRCPECSGKPSYVNHHLVEATDPPAAMVLFRCKTCLHEWSLKVFGNDGALDRKW